MIHIKTGDTMYYLNTFLLYSILGFLLETGISMITKSHFQSGIMHGPWTPIYGLGVIVIILLSNYLFYNLHMPRWIETIFAFIIITIILTALEWLGGVLIEKCFHIVFWDYSKEAFSIGKYISLSKSLIWGVGSIIFIYAIKPLLEGIVKNIPSTLTIIITFIFILDFIITFIQKAHIK